MLQPFYYLVLEGFAFVVCLLIYLNLQTKRSPMIDEKVFLYLILANMLILFADILTWYTDGKTFPAARFLLISGNVVYYLLSSIILFLWSLYVSLRVRKNNLKYRLAYVLLALLPIIFEIDMSVTSPLTGLYFYVDSANVYHRGPLCWTQAYIGIAYMLYSAVHALVHCLRSKHPQEKKEFLMLVVFTVFPLLCSLVQSQFFGLPLIWIGTTISFLIFFIQTQNSQISLDALTQLNNRGKFDAYIEQKMQDLKSTRLLYLVVLDIDNFKSINDSYGHTEGDEALIALAGLLKKVCAQKKDFAARYGGDEFALVCVRQKAETFTLMDNFTQALAYYNEHSNKPYTLNVSFGAASFSGDSEISEDALKKLADGDMYEMKASHHATVRDA